MPRLLRSFSCIVFFALAIPPALSQTVLPKPASPGDMAAEDRYIAKKRANCQREAREQKLSYMKRRGFVKNCLRR
jgi:hypothetical protein